MAVIHIDAFSDFVCAWCYIGKKKLDMAIALYQKTYPGGKSDVFDITWQPYYLDYGPSTHSVDKRELVDARLRSTMDEDQRTKLVKRMEQIGRSVGITFRGGGSIGDTRIAHRLVHLCADKPAEVRNAFVGGIFQAYHELERDITSREVLRGIAVDAGVDGAEVDRWLACDVNAELVDNQAQKNRETMAASGVPLYVVQGTHRIDGAQDAQDFMEAFISVREGDTEA